MHPSTKVTSLRSSASALIARERYLASKGQDIAARVRLLFAVEEMLIQAWQLEQREQLETLLRRA